MEELGYSKASQLKDTRKKFHKGKRVKKCDLLNEDYKNWLRENFGCVICGVVSKSNHIHHIDGRKFGTNDYMTVPLCGMHHNLSKNSYHSMSDEDFKMIHRLPRDMTVKGHFRKLATTYLAIFNKEKEE